tara:strand:+ start:707 stop:814 length:108 start_codon:yes stop_codon:yes gene_type:complete
MDAELEANNMPHKLNQFCEESFLKDPENGEPHDNS